MLRALPLAFAVLALVGCDKTKVITQRDAGAICDEAEQLVNGQCRFVCTRDGDCPTGQRCDLLVGTCVPKPPPVDAGVQVIPCTEGAVRCATDNGSVERCNAMGTFVTSEQCVQPEGFCQNERCLRCRPGASRCASGNAGIEICLDDGSDYRAVTCAAGASCVNGECAECAVGQKRCSTDMKNVEECERLPREDLSAGWQPAGDNFDGTCVTQVCEMGSSGPQCRVPACLPGATRCLNTSTQQVCGATGAYTDVLCSTVPGLGPAAECLNGTCVDECGEAQRARSYFGCEYWTTVMENLVPANIFKGNLSSAGLGTADSEFAFVVANRSVAPSVVTISRWANNAEVVVKTVTVPGRTDPATKGVAQIKVPWHHTAAPSTPNPNLSTTGKARTAYRLRMSRPVTVYQFNPLAAVVRSGTCNNSNQCSGGDGTCISGVCNYYSFSNDASLLLPAHILGTSYVGLTMEHTVSRLFSSTGSPSNFLNGSLVIVAPENATSVTIRATARTLAAVDGSYTAMSQGETRTLTLNAFEVLQISSDMPTAIVSGSSTGNLECGANPYDTLTQICRVAQGDLTGTVVTATKPIAVFGGTNCTLKPFNQTACDHVEEQLFPFVTWGKNFVASRTAPLRLTNNQFATAANAGPDYYKIVAGCPETAMNTPCPNGTTITLSAPPVAGDVLSNAGGCEAGTSLTANNCRLRGGRFVEFRSRASFSVTADQPIQIAQIFAGQDATTGSTRPVQGDPSLVLLPPVEQWRSSYTVLTAPGTRDNYLGLVVDSTRVSTVAVDGTIVANGWVTVPGTNFRTVNVPVVVGSHTIDVTPLPNQMTIPGAGVTVYGFDEYVSYGYTGGLDLTTIVTGVNPGG